MAELAPELWAKIERDIREGMAKDTRLQAMLEKLRSGKYDMAASLTDFALYTGYYVSAALRKNIGEGVAWDGKISYTMAKALLDPALKLEFDTVADFATAVIEQTHRNAGMGIRAVRPEIEQDRIDGLAAKLSKCESREDADKLLGSGVENFAAHTADSTVRENAEFVNGLGKQCFIVRMDARDCCKWCRALSGRYEYSRSTPKDVFRRHENCACQVLYEDGNGPAVDVHTRHKITDPARRQKELEEERDERRLTGKALEEKIQESALASEESLRKIQLISQSAISN